MPEEHEDLPECLKKLQSPDILRGKYPQAQGRAEGRKQRGQTKNQADFNMLLFNFQGGRPTSPSLTFLISWVSFNIQTHTDTFIWAVSILFVISTGDFHSSTFDNAQETPPPPDSCLTLYFSVKMPFSFRTPKSLLRKLELSMYIKRSHELSFSTFRYLEGRPWWSSSSDFMIQGPEYSFSSMHYPFRCLSPVLVGLHCEP